jgi:hypothetical protein
MAGKDSSQLDRAVEERRAEQPALFEEADPQLPTVRSKGRPVGSINRRTDQVAAIYRGQYGDPLKVATEIAAKNILDPAVVEELRLAWGCSRFDAVKMWAKISNDQMPYHHQTQPRAVIVNPGAPGGERVLLEIDGEFRDVTPSEDDEEEAA